MLISTSVKKLRLSVMTEQNASMISSKSRTCFGEFNEVDCSCQCRSGFSNTEGFDEELDYELYFNVNERNATDSEWQDYCGGYATCSDRVPFYKPDELNPDAVAENDITFPAGQEAPYNYACLMSYERSNFTDQDPYTEYLPYNVEYRHTCGVPWQLEGVISGDDIQCVDTADSYYCICPEGYYSADEN